MMKPGKEKLNAATGFERTSRETINGQTSYRMGHNRSRTCP
jgi:hypothetical protein